MRGGIRESADACIGKILFALASSRSQRAVVSNETAHSEEIGPRGDHEAEPVADETQASPNERASTKANPTSDADAPAKTDSGQPVENPQRQLSVTETALATALNMGYLAENITMSGSSSALRWCSPASASSSSRSAALCAAARPTQPSRSAAPPRPSEPRTRGEAGWDPQASSPTGRPGRLRAPPSPRRRARIRRRVDAVPRSLWRPE